MKSLIVFFMSALYLFAADIAMLPYVGVNVEHTYSNNKTKEYTIQREVPAECIDIAINVENFQSENLASSKIPDSCKKTFIVTRGVIQPFEFVKGVRTVGELEVLDFIENKSTYEPENYILVDSRTVDWFDKGTIPSAINIPFNEIEYDENFEFEYERAYKLLGVKILKDNKFDFSKAKTALFFCNGSWCPQSSSAMKHLIKIGFPKEKILWYRGGIAAWAGVSLTLTKNIED